MLWDEAGLIETPSIDEICVNPIQGAKNWFRLLDPTIRKGFDTFTSSNVTRETLTP